MHSIGLIEMLLVFGSVLVWAWYEYRTADHLSKQNRRRQEQSDEQQAPLVEPGPEADTCSKPRANNSATCQETPSEKG